MDFDYPKTKPWMRHAFRFGGGGGGPPIQADLGTAAALTSPINGLLAQGSQQFRSDIDPVGQQKRAVDDAEHKAALQQAQTQAAILKAQADAAQAADDETLALARRQGFASTVLTTPQDRLAVSTGTPRSLIGG